MVEGKFRKVWEQLQGKMPHMPHFLSEIRLQGLRGIQNLGVRLSYPVSVLAGGNASGKSTVLFAAACAYKVPGAGPKEYVPSTLFPDYRPRQGSRSDQRPVIKIDYEYATENGRLSMRWTRRKGWNRSFFGRRGAAQPQRVVYLRTLSNLSNPSEVRGVLRLSHLKTTPNEEPLTAAQIDFAQSMLPFQYGEVVRLSGDSGKTMLFAENKNGSSYSELHMAAGERSILRLAQEIAQLKDALVLIDEVEAGLHPWAQQLLMLHMQQLALRNHLQIIVTSHSPVVLDSVPPNARIFLERTDMGNVRICEPYRDIIQNALYGRPLDMLNLLCEDRAAEGILEGVCDVLLYEMKIPNNSVRIGRNTSAQEFPGHAAAFKKFDLLENFVFILDGDQRGEEGRSADVEEKIQKKAGGRQVPILFLPGESTPEQWVWDHLTSKPDFWASHLHMDADNLNSELDKLDALYNNATDKPSEIVKAKLHNLADTLNQDGRGLCRTVARVEAEDRISDIQPLLEKLKDVLFAWRAE